MSVEAIAWALKQPIKQSSAKFVLVVIANCADGKDFVAWPSTAYLAEATGQDRKTVLKNVALLREMGVIEDTGERKGDTKQIPVYRLNDTEFGTVQGSASRPKNGTVKQSQKRNSTENGTVPIFPTNSPNFPVEQSQFSLETVPKTGHGTVMEPSREPSGNQKYSPTEDLQARGVPPQIAADWLTLRKGKKAPVTKTALDLAEREAGRAGMPLHAALEICCSRGWAGFKAEWLTKQNGGGNFRQSEGDRRIAEFLADTRTPYPDDGMTLEMEPSR